MTDKTIKLKEDVYTELEGMLWKRESFSHGVKRLLETRRQLLGIGDVIEGAKWFNEERAKREQEKEARH